MQNHTHNREITIDAITRQHIEQLREIMEKKLNTTQDHAQLIINRVFTEDTPEGMIKERVYYVAIRFNYQTITPDIFEEIDRIARNYVHRIKDLG